MFIICIFIICHIHIYHCKCIIRYIYIYMIHDTSYRDNGHLTHTIWGSDSSSLAAEARLKMISPRRDWRTGEEKG